MNLFKKNRNKFHPTVCSRPFVLYSIYEMVESPFRIQVDIIAIPVPSKVGEAEAEYILHSIYSTCIEHNIFMRCEYTQCKVRHLISSHKCKSPSSSTAFYIHLQSYYATLAYSAFLVCLIAVCMFDEGRVGEV